MARDRYFVPVNFYILDKQTTDSCIPKDGRDFACLLSKNLGIHSCTLLAFFVLITGSTLLNFTVGRAQTNSSSVAPIVPSKPAYTILDQSPESVTIELNPTYRYEDVQDAKSGENIKVVTANGAGYFSLSFAKPIVGSPGVPAITLALLTPDDRPSEVSLREETDTTISSTLAPVPSYHSQNHELQPVYAINSDLYGVAEPSTPIVRTGFLFRTAHTQRIVVPLVRGQVGNGSFSLITHAILTIKLNPSLVGSNRVEVSPEEREMFQQIFVNGSVSQYYTSAKSDLLRGINTVGVHKNASAIESSSATWLTVQTSDEGVYKITAQDLANAGISGPIDTSTIQLFGVGGGMLSEDVTPTTGELRECAIEVHGTGSGAFSDLYFYAPGIVTWSYVSNLNGSSKLDGLYHQVNTYNSAGHYLLKIGGATSGALRIPTRPDTVNNPVQSSTVFAATVSHNEKFFEHPNESREMVGSLIPFDGSHLSIQLQSPGYSTSACSFLRVGFDSYAFEPHSVTVGVNGTLLGQIAGQPVPNAPDDQTIARTWDHGFQICAPSAPPFTVSLGLIANEQNPSVWIAWLELFYQRTTDLSNGAVPFMVIDTTTSVAYRFSNARQGEVWEVSSDDAVTRLATDDGSGNISVSINGVANTLRQFIAFSPSTLLSPQLTSTPAPSLRATIGQTGAQDIIIAPQEFLASADSLAALRNVGGQATEALKTSVVVLEDIYREFGYGGKDVTAIRDFMSYTFRHTTANGTTAPLFLTLFGSGHADYQNRITQVPERIPAYEYPGSMDRHDSPGPQELLTDDGFFGRLTNTTSPDVGVGRLSAQTDNDAFAVVNKIQHYEQGSEEGLWRGVASYVADDHYIENGQYDGIGDSHIGDTKDEIAYMLQYQNRIRVNRVFEVNYPYQITSTGYTRPGAASAILSAFNQGSVLVSFIGHGNPNVWTHESVLQVPATINQMTNFDRLAFVTTATCDFSVDDDFAVLSGGVLLMLNPAGGAISLLGTTRQVYSGDPLVKIFYQTLFNVPCDSRQGTAHIGTCIMAGYQSPDAVNGVRFYIQGDPALRLLVPRQYVVVDSINGVSVAGTTSALKLSALSTVHVVAHISNLCDGSDLDGTFNGSATITLFDADVSITRTSTFTNTNSVSTDVFNMEGPILYRGTATVTNGRLTATFIVPKDVEIDTNRGTVNILAYANDARSALGVNTSVELLPSDSALAVSDSAGPTLSAWIGSRLFHPGDTVATSTVLIVDVHDLYGLNTSTASVGHSFSAWVDDSTENMVDLSPGYVAKVNDFTSGTSTQDISVPIGPHVLHIRAFDALDNPRVLDLPFVGRGAYGLFAVSTFPSPMRDHTTFSLTQTGGEGVPVDLTISIYTIDGRRIRDIRLSGITSTALQIMWDGRDGGGVPVTSGAYVYSIAATNTSTGDQVLTYGRLVVTR